MRGLTLLFLFAIVLQLFTTVQYVESKVSRLYFDRAIPSDWVYVDKFCFDNLGDDFMGSIKWTIESPIETSPLHDMALVLYNDEPNGWNKIVATLGDSKCIDRLNETLYNVKGISPLSLYPNYTLHITQISRQWYWYMVLASCNRKDLTLEQPPFTLTMTWLNPGGFFYRQYSKDLQGVLEMHLFGFLPVLSIMGCLLIVNVFCLARLKCFHYIIRIVAVSFFMFQFSIFLSMLHYLVYGFNGEGMYWLDDIALVIRFASEIVFIMVLFLISSGWSITQTYIKHWKMLIVLFLALILLYITVFIWSQVLVAKYSILYVFATPPGMILAGLRPLMLFLFIYSLITTSKMEPKPKTKRFYAIFGILFAGWFLILPIFVIISLLLPPYLQEKTVIGIDTSFHIAYMGLLIGLLWYKYAPNFFQYLHVMEIYKPPEDDNETITLFKSPTSRKKSDEVVAEEGSQDQQEVEVETVKRLYQSAQQQSLLL